MIALTDKAKKLVIDFEGLNQPSKWPGGDSGITLGIGYDLGYVTVDQFESDWAPYLTADQLKRLKEAVGKRGIAAKNRSGQLQDVKINRKVAETVFIERNLPLYALKTEMTFPGITELPPDAQGALVSLVFNRGTSMEGDRRTEMRAIRDAVPGGDLLEIAGQLRSMKRLWINKGLDGLLRRREEEAKLVESCIPQTASPVFSIKGVSETDHHEGRSLMATNRKALCVGINKFKNLPAAALQGCVNDANDMAALCKELMGFEKDDITILTDAKATKANIMKNLASMVAGAKAGKFSYLVFSFSSHGTQVPDKSGDEPDRADEAFCPHDLAQKGSVWDPQYIISDDELHDLFVQLPKNVLLEVYLDTCHSGTGLRSIDILLDRKPRYLPPPSLEAFLEVDGRKLRSLYESGREKGIVHHILWAGCRSDQTSADAKIDGTWHGAFTYYFCKEMRKSKNKLSRLDVLKKTAADLKAGRYSQIPQLEGEATVRKSKIS
jgi:GH24 family phage-related lysozyme (muramidase)